MYLLYVWKIPKLNEKDAGIETEDNEKEAWVANQNHSRYFLTYGGFLIKFRELSCSSDAAACLRQKSQEDEEEEKE